MRTGPVSCAIQYALQASEDNGKTWSDELICDDQKKALFAYFDARQKSHAILYRAVMHLTCVISPPLDNGSSSI